VNPGGRDPLAALRQRSLQLFLASRFFSGTAMTMLFAAISWQVYDLSGSAYQLGVLGLVRFLPHAALSLVGGALADAFDRRRIAMAAQSVPLLCSVALALLSVRGELALPILFALVFAVAVASAFESPARSALLPMVVPRELFPGAVTAHSTVQALAFVSGPALAGVVIAAAGVGAAYQLHACMIAVSIATLLALRPRPLEGERRAVSVQAIAEGLRFVRARRPVLGAMSLDMFAVIFGGAQALLPVYANDILGVGPRGYGLLSASLELGALVMAVLLVLLPPIARLGRALCLAVAAYGLATIAFGLSHSFPLSVLAYVAVGMADQVSVVTRHTLVQLATPDALRGRVSSVNQVFIGASNQLGAVESGFVAGLLGATFAVVSGGVGCLLALGGVALWIPELRRYRIDRPEPAGDRPPGPAAV
jgi:MFS family permease